MQSLGTPFNLEVAWKTQWTPKALWADAEGSLLSSWLPVHWLHPSPSPQSFTHAHSFKLVNLTVHVTDEVCRDQVWPRSLPEDAIAPTSLRQNATPTEQGEQAQWCLYSCLQTHSRAAQDPEEDDFSPSQSLVCYRHDFNMDKTYMYVYQLRKKS